MSTASQLLTADDLLAMPNDGQRYELVQGELRAMAPASGEHGLSGSELFGLLWSHVKRHKLGVVIGIETGYLLTRKPDTVRAPDIAFVKTANLPPSGAPKKFWPNAPDLAVEVISPNDTLQEVDDKVAQWLEAGTVSVWVVNPKRRTVTVYRSPRDVTILSAEDELEGGDVVPGFRCRVSELFELP